MPNTSQPPIARNSRTLVVVAWLLRFVVWLFVRVEIHGGIPARTCGPAILAANHRSYLDFCIGIWAVHRYRHPVKFMVAGEYLEIPVIGPIAKACGAIGVYRFGPHAADSLTVAQRAIEEGYSIVILPEGRRYWNPEAPIELFKLHTGAARLAMACDIPILTIALAGCERIWPKGRAIPKLFPRRTVIVRINNRVLEMDDNMAARGNTNRLDRELRKELLLATRELQAVDPSYLASYILPPLPDRYLRD